MVTSAIMYLVSLFDSRSEFHFSRISFCLKSPSRLLIFLFICFSSLLPVVVWIELIFKSLI